MGRWLKRERNDEARESSIKTSSLKFINCHPNLEIIGSHHHHFNLNKVNNLT